MQSWWVCSDAEFRRRLPREQARMAAERLTPTVAAYFREQEVIKSRQLAREGMSGYWAGAGCDGDQF
jgi:hypothetical protein